MSTAAAAERSRTAVNVHSRLTVVSSTPIEPIGLTQRLTGMDHLMGSHSVHVIFYYRNSPFVKKGRYAMDLDSVRVSLSDLLSKYPRMTGRLGLDGDGNWELRCNDAGVRMFKADVGCTVDEWLRFADESDERNLTVWEDMPENDNNTWSPFRIQVNEFEGGGLAIGLSFTHLLADPTSATLFFKSWTDVERGEPVGHHPPIHHLPPPAATKTTTTATTNFYEAKSKQPQNSPSHKSTTSTFKFSNSAISDRLSKIAGKCPAATPFDYLAALFWSRIVSLNASVTPTHSMSVCLDARKLLDASEPVKFFGNGLHFSQITLTNGVLTGDDDGLAEAVDAVHRHVTGFKKDDVVSVVSWLESARKELNCPFQMYGPELTCVSLDHLMVQKDGSSGELEPMMYEAKFKNEEKPVHVSYRLGNAEGEGLIMVMPSPEGGFGRVVTVTLPVEQMAELNRDPMIMELEPTMVMEGRS